MNKYLLFITAVMLTLLSLFQSSHAQIIYGERMSVSGRMVFQSWKLKTPGQENKLNQFAFPFSFYAPLAPHWEISFNSAINSSSFDVSGKSTSIAGLTPSSVRAFHSFYNDQIFVSAGLIIPTGKTELDTMEAELAQLVSTDYLDVPIKQLGSGLGILAQLGGAAQYEWLLYGGSIAYNYTGAYKYKKSGADYNPGDEITIQGSGSTTVGDGIVDIDIAYKIYAVDKRDNKEIFKNGGILSFLLSGKYNLPRATLGLSIAEIIRGKNSQQYGNSLRADTANSNGNKTIVSALGSYMISPRVSGSLLLEYRQLSANGYDSTALLYFGKSDLFSFGGGAQFSSDGDKFTLFAGLKFSSGTANRDAGERPKISISGTEFSVGGRVKF